jgi:hypothetical protein
MSPSLHPPRAARPVSVEQPPIDVDQVDPEPVRRALPPRGPALRRR